MVIFWAIKKNLIIAMRQMWRVSGAILAWFHLTGEISVLKSSNMDTLWVVYATLAHQRKDQRFGLSAHHHNLKFNLGKTPPPPIGIKSNSGKRVTLAALFLFPQRFNP